MCKSLLLVIAVCFAILLFINHPVSQAQDGNTQRIHPPIGKTCIIHFRGDVLGQPAGPGGPAAATPGFVGIIVAGDDQWVEAKAHDGHMDLWIDRRSIASVEFKEQ